jgi:hypothetical protein
VFGSDVGPEWAIPALLNRLDPSRAHVSGACTAAGPDSQFVLVHNWLARERFDEVVQYVFPHADFTHEGRPSPCCREDSWLVYDADGPPRIRCPQPDYGGARRLFSPPPWPLRLARDLSLAQRMAVGLVTLGELTQPAERESVRHMGLIWQGLVQETRARNIPLTFVLLADRREVEAGERLPGGAPGRAAMHELAAKLGVRLVDSTDAAMEAAARPGARPLFVPKPGNPHYSEAGNELVATWVRDQLFAPRAPAAPAAAPPPAPSPSAAPAAPREATP